MEEIIEKCASIKLSLREDTEVTINEPVLEDGLVLIGKFFTKRRVNLESMTRVLKMVWKTKKTFEASDLGENKVMFLFKQKMTWIECYSFVHGLLINIYWSFINWGGVKR